MKANEWNIRINHICPECGKDKLVCDDSDFDADIYRCRDCDRRIEIWYERRPTRIVLIKNDPDDPDVEKEYWSE